MKDTKGQKVKLHCIPKTYQPILQISTAKCTSIFKEQTRLPLKQNIEKFDVVKND